MNVRRENEQVQFPKCDPVSNRLSRLQDDVPKCRTYGLTYRLLGQQTSGGYATFAYDAAYNTQLKWHQGQTPQAMTYNAANQLATMTVGSIGSAMITLTFVKSRAD